MEALGQALSPLSGLDTRFEPAVLEAARLRQEEDEAQMESEFLALKPLERAVLWRLLNQGPRFQAVRRRGAALLSRKGRWSGYGTEGAERARVAARAHACPVWKSARGEYAVDDATMHRWFEQRVRIGRWPPEDPQGELALPNESDE